MQCLFLYKNTFLFVLSSINTVAGKTCLVNGSLNPVVHLLPLLSANCKGFSGSNGRSRDDLSNRGCYYSTSYGGSQQMKTSKDVF